MVNSCAAIGKYLEILLIFTRNAPVPDIIFVKQSIRTNMKKYKTLLVCFTCYITGIISGQSESSGQVVAPPERIFSGIADRATVIQNQLVKQTGKCLSRLGKIEKRLKRKLMDHDSLLAVHLFQDGTGHSFSELLPDENYNVASFYSGHFDSLYTAIEFMKRTSEWHSDKLKNLSESYRQLQSAFSSSAFLKKKVNERLLYLKEAFESVRKPKELKKLQQQVQYFQLYTDAFTEIYNDPSKMEMKLLQLVSQKPSFSEFFNKHSMLSKLFVIPGSSPEGSAGLQTRSMISQSLIQKLGPGTTTSELIKENRMSAEGILNGIKSRVSIFIPAGNEDHMSEGVPVNTLKATPIGKRLEYGFDIQSQKARYSFPALCEIGVSLGYKLNGRSVIGIGASFKIGLGKGWDHIAITHQGMGLRSFVDWKIRNAQDHDQAWFISGAYEHNYIEMPAQLQQKGMNGFQKSGLIGLTRRYHFSLPGPKKKLTGALRLAWDLLSYYQLPRTQTFIFRIAYHLN